jgi:hypothetical protein
MRPTACKRDRVIFCQVMLLLINPEPEAARQHDNAFLVTGMGVALSAAVSPGRDYCLQNPQPLSTLRRQEVISHALALDAAALRSPDDHLRSGVGSEHLADRHTDSLKHTCQRRNGRADLVVLQSAQIGWGNPGTSGHRTRRQAAACPQFAHATTNQAITVGAGRDFLQVLPPRQSTHLHIIRRLPQSGMLTGNGLSRTCNQHSGAWSGGWGDRPRPAQIPGAQLKTWRIQLAKANHVLRIHEARTG